ncbi:MAG: GAF domain-containing protein [Chloroflexota bacterium]
MNEPDLARLFELTTDMACVVGKDGRFEWINPTFERTLGWDSQQIKQKAFVELIHPQDRDRFLAKLADLFRQKPVAGLETRIQAANGSYRWVAWRVQGIMGGGLQAVLSDVTTYKQETAVVEREYMQALYQITTQPAHIGYESAIEYALKTAVPLLDLDIGIISQIDDQVYTIQFVAAEGGLEKGQIFELGNTYCELTVAATDVVTIHHAQQSPYQKHPCYAVFELEAYIGVALTVNGKPYGTLNFSSPHPRHPFTEAEKSFVEVLARWVETRLEQVSASETIATANAIQEAILDNAGYAIIATDTEGVIQMFNPAAQHLLGYTAAEMIGKQTPATFHHPEEVVQRAQRFSEELNIELEPGFEVFVVRARRNLSNVYEWTYIDKAGEHIPVLLNVTALRNQSREIIGFLGIASDISERKKAELLQSEQIQLATFSAKIGTALTTGATIEAMLQDTAEVFVEQLDLTLVRIWAFEPAHELLELRANAGLPNGRLPAYSRRLRLGQGTAGYIANMTEAYATNNLQGTSLGDANWIKTERIIAFAGYPLFVEDHLVGVLEIFARHPFSDALLQTLNGVSQGIALSIWRDRVEQQLRQARDTLEVEIQNQTAELSEANILLRSQIQERDKNDIILRKRAAELEIVTRVSEAASAIARTDQLLQEVVNLIKVSFDLYHAHFYVLNDVGDALVLSIGAGEVGRKLLEIGYTISLSEPNSLVVRAALTRNGVIENDLQAAPGYLANALLPNSRSSMAIPMIVGDEVLGVLNVQSDKVNHFTDEDVRIQTTLASQIALALQHTRSLERAQKAIDELNVLTRRLSRDGWADYLLAKEADKLSYGYDLHRLKPLENGTSQTQKIENSLVIEHDLSVQGNTIGQLMLADPQLFPDDVTSIIQDVAGQLEAHIENLRLGEQTRLSLARTEALYVSSDRIVRARTLEEILGALAESVGLERFVGANFLFFDRSWTATSQPDYMRVAAVWTHPSAGVSVNSAGAVYRFDDLPSMRQIHSEEPTLYRDVTTDSRVDIGLRSLLVDQLNMQGIAFFPLVANREWFGVFAGLALGEMSLPDEEIRRLRSLTDQAASVIQNLRLFEQTQAALAQTEALYQISTYLNAATSLNEIAQAVAAPSVAAGAIWTGIWLLQFDHTERPYSLELSGTWSGHGHSPLPHGATVPISELAAPETFSGAINAAPLFISDITQSVPTIAPEAKVTYERMGARALITLPLRYGERAIGMVTIAWPHTHAFEEADMSFYRLLMSQVGVAVQGQLLLQESRQRSEQLERLARIEASLSQANDEEEILRALTSQISVDAIKAIGLAYIDQQTGSGNLTLQVVSFWHLGQFLPQVTETFPLLMLEEYSVSQLWLERPDEMLVILDVENDPRADDEIRAEAKRDAWRSIVLIPLRSGGRWQGVLLFTWATPHVLTNDERFLFAQLMEPLAATVASRRAFVAQQMARREMERLYEASRRLNEASDLQELLVTIVESLSIPDLSRANLWLFDRDDDEIVTRTYLLSAWSNDPVVLPMALGTYFSRGDGGFGDYLPIAPLQFVENMAEDKLLPDRVRQTSLERQVASLIILPLLVQGEHRGLIAMSTQVPHQYTEEERQICRSLAPQIALVLENKRLLEAAQARAEQERLLRQVTEKVRRSTHVETVMQTAVTEIGRILGRRATIYLDDNKKD